VSTSPLLPTGPGWAG